MLRQNLNSDLPVTKLSMCIRQKHTNIKLDITVQQITITLLKDL